MATIRSILSSSGLHSSCKLMACAAALSFLGACANSGQGSDLLTRSIGTRVTGASLTQTGSATHSRKVARWEKALKNDPKNADTALNFAKSLKAAGAMSRAYSVLRNSAARHPNNVLIASEFGRLAVQLDQLATAESVLARIDRGNNLDWRAISARGTIRAKQGKHEKARKFYKRALEIAPNEPSILNNLALTYALDGEADRAESLLRRAADKDRSPKRVTENLALVLGLQGRFDEARQISKKSLPTKVADSNLDFLRRMVRVAETPARAAAKSKRIAMADPAPAQKPAHQKNPAAKPAAAQNTQLAAKPKSDAVPMAAEKKPRRKALFGAFKFSPRKNGREDTPKKTAMKPASKTKPIGSRDNIKAVKPVDVAPSTTKSEVEKKSVVATKSVKPPHKKIKAMMPVVVQQWTTKTEIEKKSVVATKPVKPRKKIKTAKPVAISPWTTKTEIEKKSVVATPKSAKDKLKARGAMQSESNQVIKSPLPILPVPSQETVSAAPEWTVKISQNQNSK